jgi:predicted nucleic acid-binding protein
MNGTNLFVDTNILLYLLNGDKVVSELLDSKKIFISFISEIELLSFRKLSTQENKIIRQLLSDCTLIDMNEEIKLKTIELKLNYNLKIPDAIIGATSSYLKIPLVTADKQFKSVKNIDLIFYQI